MDTLTLAMSNLQSAINMQIQNAQKNHMVNEYYASKLFKVTRLLLDAQEGKKSNEDAIKESLAILEPFNLKGNTVDNKESNND